MTTRPGAGRVPGPLRVLVVARWYPSHDAPSRGVFVADQVRALAAAGIDVVVASWDVVYLTDPTRLDDALGPWRGAIGRRLPLATPVSWGGGVPVAHLPAVVPVDPSMRHPVDLAEWQAATLVPFGQALDASWPIDLIHAHTGLPDGAAAADLADALDVPLMVTEHDGGLERRLGDPRAVDAYRRLFAPRRSVVAVGPRLADAVTRLVDVPRDRVDVIPNIADTSLFRPRPEVPRDPNTLLWVGSRLASKGMSTLLEAVALVAQRWPDIRLRAIGPATAADDAGYREVVERLGIADRVTFEPTATRAVVADAMAHSALFVHPSPHETFGIVALEALASGLPVVAVAPAIVDLIGADGRYGEAVTDPGPEALAAAIDRALQRRDAFRPDDLVAAAAPYGPQRVVAAILDRCRALLDIDALPRGARVAVVPTDLRGTPPGSLLVATRGRSTADRVAALPEAASAGLVIVGPTPPPRRGPLAAALRRATRLVASGRTAARLPASHAEPSRVRAVATAARSLSPDADVVAADGDDVLVIAAAGLSARLAPGSLRWLADRADADRADAGHADAGHADAAATAPGSSPSAVPGTDGPPREGSAEG